ncbi:hypothetical protein EDB92DRAFT_1944104 [Lactarius akahatsu]|uniref:G domain-containing protein n=1 Tax=Lactarius akahatsu TaxID=416441 RepID=A0AAD4Q9E0_9AGAM|nr:hypothetical protein EDB92DRAFT_1944104 [Lactarius akahatsu]
MGNCSSLCGTAAPDLEVTPLQQPSSLAKEERVPSPKLNRMGQVCRSLENGSIPPAPNLGKAFSVPPNARPTKGSATLPPLPPRRVRAPSEPSSSRLPHPEIRPTSVEHSRASPTRPVTSYPARRPLDSTVRQVLPEQFKFRILVVGKSGSGKSSLIKAVFKVDETAELKYTRGKVDINAEFQPEDNCYLIVHECSGLEPQAEDLQNLQTIRDFILHRTDASCSDSKRLHAVWICVPASDAIDGQLGKGAEEILGLRTVPVVLVFTKFDMVVSKVLFDIPRGDAQPHERAKAQALKMLEESCHRLFHRDSRVVPVSGTYSLYVQKPRHADLVENLVVATDRGILGSSGPSTRFGVREKSRVNAVPLAWSAALRASRDIAVKASIEVGRSRYWRRLWSSDVDFAGHSLKSCVYVIHLDLVEIWNLRDRAKYLSDDGFMAKMSHLVKDLEGPASSMISGPCRTRTGVEFAGWVRHVYRGSERDIRCVMGYIVNLTVILDSIFSKISGDIKGDISLETIASVINGHIDSGKRNKIHDDIWTFVTETFPLRFSVSQDLILEKIIDLIQEFLPPHRK